LAVGLEESVPHRRGSFHEDWSELLERFAHRRKRARQEQLRRAQREAEQGEGCRIFRLNQALFEKSAD
jgi:hypothetical protein